MTLLGDDLELLGAGTERLLASADQCDEAAVRRGSRLAGWTVAHVITHLARNADSHVSRLQAALDGRIVPQYEGGRPARDAAIESGARRPRDEIVDDLHLACEQLDGVLESFPEEAWTRQATQRERVRGPASSLPFTRVMEVEVHHVDLGRSYETADWPLTFVDRALPTTIDRVTLTGADVAGPVASWHLHRTDGEGEWVIRRSPHGSVVTAEHAKADCAVRGSGRELLAWLLGRVEFDSAELDVFGDAALARQFPSLYPYG